MAVLLSDYLATLRRYLHDPNDTLFPIGDKIAYLNEALQQRDLDTGGNRVVTVYPLVAGQTDYSLAAIATAGAIDSIFDVVGVTLLYQGYRVLLETYSYSELVTTYLAYQNWTDRPAAWCRRGSDALIIAPAPAIVYSVEIDCSTFSGPTTLAALTDPDPLDYPYTYPVPMYAAYLACQYEKKDDRGELFKRRYTEAVVSVNAARTGIVPSMYPVGT